jgi:hypothetical protein
LQFTPAPSAEAVGGPLLNPAGEVVGVLGGSVMPGSRFDRKNLSVSPALFFSMGSNTAATPITSVRPGAAPLTLAHLHSNGSMSRAVRSAPSFQHGGTSLAVKSVPAHGLPPSVSEFSRRDGEVWVYSIWQRKDKVGKGVMAAEVFDPQNRLRVTITPKKITIPSDVPMRFGFSFPAQSLSAGVYRVDLLFEGQAVWRTFFTIVD